jgi:hypothetical protein
MTDWNSLSLLYPGDVTVMSRLLTYGIKQKLIENSTLRKELYFYN